MRTPATPVCALVTSCERSAGAYVRGAGFEPALLAYETSGVPNSPNRVCACRDTAISAGSHFVGASGEVFLVFLVATRRRGVAGFEPAITESKSVALPLGYTLINTAYLKSCGIDC